MSKVGKSEIRVDAFDKVTGRTKYYEDRMPAGALYARIKPPSRTDLSNQSTSPRRRPSPAL